MEEEQVYTVPLRDARNAPRKDRAARAIGIVKGYMERHLDARRVKITSDLNERIWSNGSEKPPSKVRVRATKNTEGVVEVSSLE